MKTILLLGGYGFIGTNLLKYIDTHFINKYRVIVFDMFPKHSHDITFKCVQKTYSGNFSDALLINTIFQTENIDLVIHSLSTTVPSSSLNAQFDVESNIIPTLEVLNCMVKNKVRDIVFLSSGGAIYGEEHTQSLKENIDVFPISSYGVIKLAIEKYLFLYKQNYNINPLVLRLSNPYGKYHYSEKQGIINIALRKAIHNQIFTVWGNGNATKDYIYIDDVCNILFTLLEKEKSDAIYNIGSGELLSVNQILESIKKYYPKFKWEYNESKINDVKHVVLNLDKLTTEINIKLHSIKEVLPILIDYEN